MRKVLHVALFLPLLACAVLAQNSASAGATTAINREIARIEKELSQKPDSDEDWKQSKGDISALIENAKSAATAGRTYLALEQLGKARGAFISLDAMKSSAAAKRDMAAFDEQWKTQSVRLMEVDKKDRELPWGNSPAIVRALGENEISSIAPLTEASRAYAQVTAPESGFYYLANAESAAQFADFCHSLNLQRHGAAVEMRSIVPELQDLQKRVDAAFQPPRSIEKHQDFILINSILKTAKESDSSRLYFAAWYRYLQGLTQFGMLDATVPDAGKQADIRKAVAAAGERLRQSPEDDSIAQLFLEKAEQRLAAAKISDNDWKVLEVVAEQTLPAYYQARKTPLAPSTGTAGRLVTVTLVRWPYT